MRWLPVILLLVAIAIAVIVARGLPEDYGSDSTNAQRQPTPVDDAADAARGARSQ